MRDDTVSFSGIQLVESAVPLLHILVYLANYLLSVSRLGVSNYSELELLRWALKQLNILLLGLQTNYHTGTLILCTLDSFSFKLLYSPQLHSYVFL